MPFAGTLVSQVGFSSAAPPPLYSYTGTLTFTPAAATGQNGPILSQCRTAYSSFGVWVSNTAYFNMITQGIQRWTAPATRTYTVVCAGAGKTNAAGAVLTATLSLTKGQIINIMVGQNSTAGGGCGGSFIVSSANAAILVAGGGGGQPNGAGSSGGGGASLTGTGVSGGTSASGTSNNMGITGTVTSGAAGGGGGSGSGGGSGAGKQFSSCGPCTGSYSANTNVTAGGAGGGGFTGNGTGRFINVNAGYTNVGGNSYTNGGVGGGPYAGGFGGFGGGGSSGIVGYYYSNCCPVSQGTGNGVTGTGGGGGGYSGGGGGGDNGSSTSAGGGGGSFSSVALSASNVTNVGNGYVSIT